MEREEFLFVGRHIASCDECGGAATAEDARMLHDALLAEEGEHPEVATLLTAYVDGRLDAEQRRDVATHLETCARCREDADDLVRERDAIVRRVRLRLPLPLAAAASIAFITAMVFFAMRIVAPLVSTPTAVRKPQPAGYGRADWDAAVRVPLLVAPPIIAELRPAADVLRGSAVSNGDVLKPGGEVLESAQPGFTWPAEKGARYVVSVFDEKRHPVAESPELKTPTWTPPSPLARGVVYSWQVEVRKGSDITTLPVPPAPPLRFAVLAEAAQREIDDARRRFPADHLLLGTLYARAGVVQRAREELAASQDPRARTFLTQIETW